MMLWVHCAFLVLCSSVGCEQEEVTEIHGDITGPGPKGNMFEEVFKYAFKNFYKNNPSTQASSVESHRRYNKNYARRHHYYHPPPPPPIQPAVQPIAPQYIFPQHYYMPPPAPPIPPYPAYHYPPYYPPHPPPPPPHYVYPYPPLKEKSAEKTTQNLWELYQQLKVKFETTNPDQNTPLAENYRHYNRRVQNINGYPPRENRRYYQQNFQTVQQQYQQPEVEKVSVAPEEPFARYSAAVQSRQKIERPAQYVPVETKTPVETRPTVAATKEIPTPAPETPKPATIARVVGKEQIFEPRQEEDDAVKIAKVKHWENIISNIKSSLGITDEPDPEMTVPDFVKRDHSEIAAIMFTESPEDPEAKKYGITLIHNSQPDSIDDAHIGFDWKNEEKLARKPTRDMLQLYKEYKEKYEFPDYLSEKRRLERAEYKYKKKLLYKSPCSQEFRDRHDKMGKIVHRALVQEYNLQTVDPDLSEDEYEPEPVVENEKYKMLWDLEINLPQDEYIYYNRPDMVIWNKKRNSVRIIDFAVVNYDKVIDTRMRKMKKYSELAREIMHQWKISDVKIIPIIVTTSGGVPSCLRPNLSLLGVCKDDVLKRLHDSVIMSSKLMYKNVEHNSFHSHER